MKTLALSRPLILILVGLPGAGKSFFARQFSDMFDAPMVGFNRITFELFEKPQLSAAEQDIVRRIALYQMDELVKTHRSFIVDGGSNTVTERQQLEKLAKASGYGTLVIWVQTDDNTCRLRATKRNPKRSPDDALTPALTDVLWAEQAKRFHQPIKESYMVISGKHAFSTQAKMVLRKLSTPHAEEARTAHQQNIQDRKPQQTPERSDRITVRPARPASAPTRRNVVIS
ncbi:MAG TPA: AAA family ATPase [Candidatus Saccharimonadales bacterium]|nr:AAA family ATPase [Candidatus Saccharimonadales bacterium]